MTDLLHDSHLTLCTTIEAQLEAHEARSSFVEAISHDLRLLARTLEQLAELLPNAPRAPELERLAFLLRILETEAGELTSAEHERDFRLRVRACVERVRSLDSNVRSRWAELVG